ncbi:DUF4835 family protein [Nemorincola caseinilytica]|uniref:DUF4835 family protein n=1 Tax=Nemorincola caseinilytica TaxID=2054315 RepID=A0ABP8N8U7_9BACT
MLRKLFSIGILLVWCVAAQAQELNCKVTVKRIDSRDRAITGVDPELFTNMQRAVTELVNSRRWTTDDYATTEKIDCNIFITITGNNIGGDPNTFSGTFSIQAARPVYNSSYTSTIVNYVDRDLTFKYSQFNPLNFDDNRAFGSDPLSSNLTAVVGYYVYLVLAMDYDSFSPLGGTNYLKKAQNIVNSAPDNIKGINGWQAKENNRNRYWLVDQLLNQRFQEARNFWYIMHREGLDSMSMKPTDARARIMTNVKKLYQVNRENPNSVAIQFLLSSKGEEFLRMLEATPRSERQQYISMLAVIDVPNSNKYNALK